MLAALTTLVHTAAHGALDPHATQHLCSAKLIPLRKKDGGVRPIAVGETLRRVIAKHVARSPAAKALADSLAPLQVAFRQGGPCEVTSMAFAEYARSMTPSSELGVLQLDISNAFNSISRVAILEELAAQAPEMQPWTRASFQPAALYCGDATFWSTNGVQQGDPLGPLLFATGLQRAIREAPPISGLEAWYLDDGAIIAPLPQLEALLSSLLISLPAIGLSLNLRKTTLWGPDFGPGGTWTAPEGSA